MRWQKFNKYVAYLIYSDYGGQGFSQSILLEYSKYKREGMKNTYQKVHMKMDWNVRKGPKRVGVNRKVGINC